MRIAPALIAFVFLGAAAAAVVPDIHRRNAAVADNNSGHSGHNASMSSVPIPSSGLPTEPFPHSMPSGVRLPPSDLPPAPSMQSMPGGAPPPYPASLMSTHPSFTPSLPPLSGGPAPTGGHPPPGSPSSDPDHPTPSAGNHAMANRRAPVADGGPHSFVPPMPSASSPDLHRPTEPPASSLSPPPHLPPSGVPSGVPSGTPGGHPYPIPSFGPAPSALPNPASPNGH